MFNRSLLKDITSLTEVDGYSAWREKEAYSLSDLVQRRLKHLQNPSDCNNAKKLICNLNKVSVCCFCYKYSVELFLKQLFTCRAVDMVANYITQFTASWWPTVQKEH